MRSVAAIDLIARYVLRFTGDDSQKGDYEYITHHRPCWRIGPFSYSVAHRTKRSIFYDKFHFSEIHVFTYLNLAILLSIFNNCLNQRDMGYYADHYYDSDGLRSRDVPAVFVALMKYPTFCDVMWAASELVQWYTNDSILRRELRINRGEFTFGIIDLVSQMVGTSELLESVALLRAKRNLYLKGPTINYPPNRTSEIMDRVNAILRWHGLWEAGQLHPNVGAAIPWNDEVYRVMRVIGLISFGVTELDFQMRPACQTTIIRFMLVRDFIQRDGAANGSWM